MRKLPGFLASLERRLAPGYVLAGAEGLLRNEAERAVVRAVFGDSDPGPNLVMLDGAGDPAEPFEAARVIDEARSLSLLGGTKVVVVRRADAVVKDHIDAFLNYLANPEPDAVVVLHMENWDKRRAYAEKLDAFAVDCGSLYETAFGELEVSARSSLGRWVADRASRAHGLRLLPDAVVRLIELVGTGLAALDNAMERLALVGGVGAAVSREDVDAIAAPSRSQTHFKVAELLIAGRAEDALAAADACFREGVADVRGRVERKDSSVATILMSEIARQLEILHSVHGLLDEGKPIRTNAGKLGVPPFKADGVERAARSLGLDAIQRALELVFEAEWAVKRGDAEPRFAVERLVLDIGRAFRGSPGPARSRRYLSSASDMIL